MVSSQRGSKSLSRTFSFTIPGCWNDLPTLILNAGSLSTFKQQLKTHLFRHYLTIIKKTFPFSISSSFSHSLSFSESFSLALNGGGRFLSSSSPLSSLLCSLVSWETLSALLSKLKYYGLTGLLMQLTLLKLGFRGTWLPWRNVRSRLYDGAWERWRIVCLAALSVEDIDIYLFGTMITGILLIGLGFTLGYRIIQKTGTAVQSPTRLPVWLKLWEERSALSTETIIAIWILPRRSSRLYKGKLIKMRPKWDQNGQKRTESSLQKLECLLAPKTKQSYLFLAPLQWPWQGCCCNLPRVCNAVRRSCVPPPPYRHYRHYRHCPPPPPTIRLCSLRSAGLVKRVWPAPDQWLRDQMAACWAGFTSPVAMSWCMCFCVAEVFFLFSHCTPQGA